jgi:hypothetical protein
VCLKNIDFVTDVIPASEARRESSLKKDSGQAGMTSTPPQYAEINRS